MSETFRAGDPVVFRTTEGELLRLWGTKTVDASDLSWVTVNGTKYNAGTLQAKFDPLEHISGFIPHVIAHPTETDFAEFHSAAEEAKRDERANMPASQLECHTCLWWRPPFDTGPGNCHNGQVKQLTNIGGETYAPPTPAHFGCVQWESKDQPENGEE